MSTLPGRPLGSPVTGEAGRVSPIWDQWFLTLATKVDQRDTVESTVATTGTITSLPLPFGTGDLLIRMNNATLASVQGIAAGLPTQRLTIVSVGAGQVDLAHQSGSAAAGERLILCATSGVTSLAGGSGVSAFVYDATTARWRLTCHHQGAWIAIPYSAGDFTATTGTWTVDLGDVLGARYWLMGRTLCLGVSFHTTTVAGGPAAQLRYTIPGGFSAAGASAAFIAAVNNSVGVGGTAWTDGSTPTIVIFSPDQGAFMLGSGSTWANAANTTYVKGEIFFEVA